jgi:starch synthase
MRYGAVPVARYTGGLVDTVDNLTSDLSQGDGFVFSEYSVEAMAAAVTRAAESYQHKEAWNQVMRRIMTKDFSWHASGRKYEDVYRKARELHGRT